MGCCQISFIDNTDFPLIPRISQSSERQSSKQFIDISLNSPLDLQTTEFTQQCSQFHHSSPLSRSQIDSAFLKQLQNIKESLLASSVSNQNEQLTNTQDSSTSSQIYPYKAVAYSFNFSVVQIGAIHKNLLRTSIEVIKQNPEYPSPNREREKRTQSVQTTSIDKLNFLSFQNERKKITASDYLSASQVSLGNFVRRSSMIADQGVNFYQQPFKVKCKAVALRYRIAKPRGNERRKVGGRRKINMASFQRRESRPEFKGSNISTESSRTLSPVLNLPAVG